MGLPCALTGVSCGFSGMAKWPITAKTGEEKLDILATAHMQETGASQTEAYASCLAANPALAAQIAEEAEEKKKRRSK